MHSIFKCTFYFIFVVDIFLRFVFELVIEATKKKVSKKEETGNEMNVMVNKKIFDDDFLLL